MATSTVSAVLARIGLGKLSRLEPPEPIRRYERSRPGELIHIDVKKLGRIGPHGAGHRIAGNARDITKRRKGGAAAIGWECVHVCVDDATRLAYVEVLPDEKAKTVDRLPAAGSRLLPLPRHRGRAADDRQRIGLSLRRPRPRLSGAGDQAPPHPALPAPDQRQGRAIHPHDATRVGLRRGLRRSPERAAALSGWIERYNFRRRHGALGHRPPIQRLRELSRNNVAGIYT